MDFFENRFLIFGGTGSLGRTLIRRLLDKGVKDIYVFSRDEAKHHKVAQEFQSQVSSIVGDIRDYDSVLQALYTANASVIINAAALKQVPICEDYPMEAVKTNVLGTQNLVKAIHEYRKLFAGTIKALSISTDKAAKPVNSYGMTKALQERIHLNGNNEAKNMIFNCVRYGNVLESTGSVIPVFKHCIENNKDLMITNGSMTRFLMSLDQAVNLIFKALQHNEGGNVFIPEIKSANMVDLAKCLLEAHNSKLSIYFTNTRPGEKIDEILVSEEEIPRTIKNDDIYIIKDIKLPYDAGHKPLTREYSSFNNTMTKDELKKFLKSHSVI